MDVFLGFFQTVIQGDSLSSLGYFSGWVATRSNSELAKFIMKVTLERRVARVARVAREPGRARDDDEDDEDDADDADDDDDHEVDIQVVEFWKRMGFEDIAEVYQKTKKKTRKSLFCLPNLDI